VYLDEVALVQEVLPEAVAVVALVEASRSVFHHRVLISLQSE
jgi:hypothetical protein